MIPLDPLFQIREVLGGLGGGEKRGRFGVYLLSRRTRGEDMAAAIAAAARKRAEKLGVQNEEVDESNVGKTKDTDLRNPYLSKVKIQT